MTVSDFADVALKAAICASADASNSRLLSATASPKLSSMDYALAAPGPTAAARKSIAISQAAPSDEQARAKAQTATSSNTTATQSLSGVRPTANTAALTISTIDQTRSA